MRSVLFQLTLFLGLVLPPAAGQAVYRCVDAVGNVTFSQLPCAPGQAGEQVTLDGGTQNQNIDPSVCEEIRRLAELIFPHVHNEDSILKVYEKLGGRAGLSAGVTSAINYVYNFRYNPQARAELVVRLTHEKCLEKGFGILRRDELPDWDRFTYKQENSGTKARVDNSLCAHYAEKIRALDEQLLQVRNKSDELRLQTEKEHLQHLRHEQCNMN